MSPGSESDVVAATPKDTVPPTAPVIFVGCDAVSYTHLTLPTKRIV